MNRRKQTLLARWVAILLVITAASGCASSARVGQFDQFAQVGIAFTKTIPAVLDDAFVAAVNVDSLVLTENRPDQSEPKDRLNAINTSNTLLKNLLEIHNDLKTHALLLQNYFNVLQTLASTEAESSGLTDMASGLVGELAKLSPVIRSAKIGNAAVADLVSPTVNLAFTAFQAGVLNRELERNGKTIERELDLQRAALQAIATAMRSDLEAKFTAQDRDKIIGPFIASAPLPSGWETARLISLQRRVQISSVDAAFQAAQNLHLSYIALVENRLTSASITTVLQNVNGIISLIGESQ